MSVHGSREGYDTRDDVHANLDPERFFGTLLEMIDLNLLVQRFPHQTATTPDPAIHGSDSLAAEGQGVMR